MQDWTQGYVAEINYTHGFYQELTPSLLCYALLLKGIRPPRIEEGFTYCELGCGQGFSTNLLAAANPKGDFWATDFNPSHVAGAKALADAAGMKNVRFFDKSFEEFLETDTPEFDFICLHGIYSWISPENRRIIVEFIRRKLKFGGIAYLSYNCLPGWAAAMPLRELMIEHAATSSGPIASRIDKAISFASDIVALNAGYFRNNPAVAPRLEKVKGMSRNYLAHEYFNRDWNPQYFAEVVKEMTPAKLAFAASAFIGDHIDAVNLTPEMQKKLDEITDPIFRETIRDYFINQQFRRDIFTRGAVQLSPVERMKLFASIRYALVVPRENAALKVSFSIGEVNLQEDIYAPLLDILATGARTMEELAQMETFAKLGGGVLLQALTVLVGAGYAKPTAAESDTKERLKSIQRFNRVILDRARFGSELAYLASPVTGTGQQIDWLSQLFLQATLEKSDLAAHAWAVLSALNQRLVVDGKTLETPEENLAELRAKADQFTQRSLPVLRSLGIA